MLKNPQKIILAILVLFLIGIFWRFSTLIYFPAAGGFLEKDEITKLHPAETLQQVFTVPASNLTRIEIILRSPGIAPDDQVEVKLMDGACKKTLAQGNLADSFLSSNNLYDFSFPRIDSSAHQTYCLALTFQPQKSTAKSLQFFYRPETGASFKNLSTGEILNDQSLSFRLVYKNPSFYQNMRELNQRISQYKPAFLKAGSLSVIVGGFICLSLFFLIALIFL